MATAFNASAYEVEENVGSYMSLQQGENRFRILDNPISGWEYWVETNTEDGGKQRKPRRFKDYPSNNEDLEADTKVKAFKVFPVYNFNTNKIQILEITQKTIQRAIATLVNNKAWGNPIKYTLAVTKTGEGMDTDYSVVAEPPMGEEKEKENKLIEEKIKEYQDLGWDLNQLYSSTKYPYGGNPFLGNDNSKEVEDVLDTIDVNELPFK